jgi:small subunit ribosomal protein S13
MARFLGVEIPNNKKLEYGLRYVYGIGPHRAKIIADESGIDTDIRI